MVVLHTFFTDETVVRAVETVRRAAEEAGRDPSAVRIWSCYATVPDTIPYDLRLKKTVGRLATYLQGYGDLLVETNGWDPALLAAFRADEAVQSVPGAIDAIADTETLERIAAVVPEAWLEPAAYGTPEQCAERVLRQFELGVDGVIMHGATPAQLAPVAEAYRAIRPAGRFDHLPANPGLARS
jgi:alkanesulfonate monooxygenase SsuD/methylene tetrahydromethanopterin reductase-like flavin-dependent oxidoreductase (luciferase family)